MCATSAPSEVSACSGLLFSGFCIIARSEGWASTLPPSVGACCALCDRYVASTGAVPCCCTVVTHGACSAGRCAAAASPIAVFNSSVLHCLVYRSKFSANDLVNEGSTRPVSRAQLSESAQQEDPTRTSAGNTGETSGAGCRTKGSPQVVSAKRST